MDQAGAKGVVPSLYISYTLNVTVAQWFSTLAVPENYVEDFFLKTERFLWPSPKYLIQLVLEWG